MLRNTVRRSSSQKMLPVLVLVVLCGFLAQDVQGHSGQVSLSMSKAVVENVMMKKMNVQDWKKAVMAMPLKDALGKTKQENVHTGGLGGLLGVAHNIVGNALNLASIVSGCRIKEVQFIRPEFNFNPDKQQMDVANKFVTHVEWNVPMIPGLNLVTVYVKVPMISGLKSERNSNTGRTSLIIKACQCNPVVVKIKLLGHNRSILNNIIEMFTKAIESVFPILMNGIFCPLLTVVFQFFVTLLQGFFLTSGHGAYQMSAQNYLITNKGMMIDYTDATGGQTQVKTPPSRPLHSRTMEEKSSINMLMDSDFVQNTINHQMPPQNLVFDHAKVAALEGSLRSRSVLRRDIALHHLKLSSDVPKVHLTVGKMTIVQEITISAVDHNNQDIFVTKAKCVFDAHVSLNGKTLTVMISQPRITDLTLTASRIGNLNVGNIKHCFSGFMRDTFLPHVNNMLSTKGYEMPGMEEFGVKKFECKYHERELEVYSLETLVTNTKDERWEEVKWEAL